MLMELTGAQILVESLKKEGVDVIFGYPGGVVIPIFDVLFDDKDIEVILPRHEQGAAHAADGYARATGKVGVCLATSGPGATNTVTGIATANMDSVPMVVITGQVASSMIGNDAFQEVDMVGITRPITKHNFLVKDIKELASTIKKAFHIANTGRKGPVLIDLPVDVSKGKCEFKYPDEIELRGYSPNYAGHPGQIKKAMKMLMDAKRPVVMAGGGIISSDAADDFRKFINKSRVPVTTTLLGLGSVDPENELWLGMPGMHGTFQANYALTECDLILSIGARFDDRVTGKLDAFAPDAKVIHVDIDPTSISKSVGVDIPIVGDAKSIIPELTKNVKECQIDEWRNLCKKWADEHPASYVQEQDGDIKPQYVIEKISELTKGDCIISTEVGQNQMWAAQYFKFKHPRTFLTSGGLGTMGYGFPAALGAQVACPDKLVIDIAGDGSIQMNIQELATIAVYNLPVKIIILNNGYLGMVRQWQELFFDRRYSSTCLLRDETCPPECKGVRDKTCHKYIPDFVSLAKAYGVNGVRVDSVGAVEDVLKQELFNGKPSVIEFVISREENVFPMVPAGKAINEIMGMA
jgi:acetolactate synthase-1/2/3 large subunit